MADSNRRMRRKVRNAYLISTVSIALVLFLLGGVGYLILGALGATERLREQVTVYVMLKDGLSDGARDSIGTRLASLEQVKEARFVSKEQAAQDFKTYLNDDFMEFLDQNPLPDSYEVTVAAESSEKTRLAALEKELLAWDGIDEVVYQRNVIEQIGNNINAFNLVLLFFGATLLFISLILLNNTIRMRILSKRYIVNTMKMVGATRGFIVRPFLIESVLQGVYAGLISWAMLILMIVGLQEGLPEVTFVRDRMWLVVIFAGMMVGGIVISVLFTFFAVRKFLRMNAGNIHMY